MRGRIQHITRGRIKTSISHYHRGHSHKYPLTVMQLQLLNQLHYCAIVPSLHTQRCTNIHVHSETCTKQPSNVQWPQQVNWGLHAGKSTDTSTHTPSFYLPNFDLHFLLTDGDCWPVGVRAGTCQSKLVGFMVPTIRPHTLTDFIISMHDFRLEEKKSHWLKLLPAMNTSRHFLQIF